MQDLLNQSVTLISVSRSGVYGNMSVVDGATIDCRIVDAIKFIPSRDGLGESISITKTLWVTQALEANQVVKYDDKYYIVQLSEEWREEDGELLGARHLLSNYVIS